MTKLLISLLLLALVAEMLADKLTVGPAAIRPPPTSPPANPPSGVRSHLNFTSNSTSKSKTPKGRLNQGNWPDFLPLDCDGILDDMPANRRPSAEDLLGKVIMLINNEDLYFFYKKFVVIMQLPEFQKLFNNDLTELTDKDIQLIRMRPYYGWYIEKSQSEAKDYLTSADSFDAHWDAFRGSIHQSVWGAAVKMATVLALEQPENSDSKIKTLYYGVDFGDSFGKLYKGNEYFQLPVTPKREGSEKSFSRVQQTKFLEIVYGTYRQSARFRFSFEINNVWQERTFDRIQAYETENMVYWDNSPEAVTKSNNSWWGTLVELDSINVLHFHTYLFQAQPENVRLSDQLRVFAHYSYDLHLLDFFDCRRKDIYPVRRTNQLKGVIFYTSPSPSKLEYTLVFIDQFYYVIGLDLMKINFHLHAPGLQKQVLKVKFADKGMESKVLFDLGSTKYVKHVVPEWMVSDSKEKYFTFGSNATFSAHFGDDFDPTKPLSLRQSNIQAHKCAYSMFSVKRFHFCIERRDYYLISHGDFLEDFDLAEDPFTYKRPIAEIFNDPKIDYDGDDIEYVFDYGEETVWVTYHSLLIFKKFESFEVTYADLTPEFGNARVLKASVEKAPYRKIENCLWTRCEPIHPDENGEIEDPRRHRGRSFSGNHSRASG